MLLKRSFSLVILFTGLIALFITILFCSSACGAQEEFSNVTNDSRLIIYESRWGYGQGKETQPGHFVYNPTVNAIEMGDMVMSTSMGASQGVGANAAGALLFYDNISDDLINSMELTVKNENLQVINTAAANREIYQWGFEYPFGNLRFLTREGVQQVSSITGDLTLNLQKFSADTLDAEKNMLVKNRPQIVVTLKNGAQEITNISGGMLMEIPYEKQAIEDMNSLIVYMIDKNGTMSAIRNSKYKAGDNALGERGVMQVLIENTGKYLIAYDPISAKDVSDWSLPYVKFVTSRGIMDCTKEGFFEPQRAVTRGEVAHILYCLSDQKIPVDLTKKFTDVTNVHPYAQEIAWLTQKEIILGFEDGSFKPEKEVSKQEMAVMLSRYLDKSAFTYLPMRYQEKNFNDHAQIGSFAKEAVYYMQKAGVISGQPNGSFAPTKTISRAECAKMVTVLTNEIIDGKILITSK